MEKPKKLIDEIPIEVRQYLAASESLARAGVQEKYPGVKNTLQAPATRHAIVRYLASKEPWADPAPDLIMNALSFLLQGANAKELEAIHALIEYPNPWVRIRLCEYMMAIYYPAHDQAAMAGLFRQMLADPDEIVRVRAARWIKALNLASGMRPALEEWSQSAREHKWEGAESYQIIQGLLGHGR
jgi:hypothetical protein